MIIYILVQTISVGNPLNQDGYCSRLSFTSTEGFVTNVNIKRKVNVRNITITNHVTEIVWITTTPTTATTTPTTTAPTTAPTTVPTSMENIPIEDPWPIGASFPFSQNGTPTFAYHPEGVMLQLTK